MDGETEFPRDIGPVEGGRSWFLWGFPRFSSVGVRHGSIFKYFREWACL